MNIQSWLIQEITVAAPAGRSGSGDPTYGAPQVFPARIERNVRMRVGAEDSLLDVHAVVTSVPIAVNSRVWFPGDDTASALAARRPLDAKTASTKDGSYTIYETYFAA